MENTIIRRMITFELPAADIKTLNIEEEIKKIKEIGAEIVVVFANSYIEGFSYYKSKFAKPHPDLNGRDIFKEILETSHKEGLKVYAYLNSKFSGKLILEEIPGTQCVRPNGTPIGINNVVMMCINSPFADYFKKIVREVCENYPIEGIYIDEASFQTICTCKYCREKFKKKFGVNLPISQDWDSKIWKDFIKWRYEIITNFVKEIRQDVKSINKNINFFFQTAFPISGMELEKAGIDEWRATSDCNGWHTPLIYAQSPKNFEIEDIISIEDFGAGFNLPIWWIGATLKYLNSFSPQKSKAVLLESPKLPWLLSNRSPTELKLCCFESLANYGSPWFPKYAPGIAEEKGWNGVKEAFSFIKKNEEFFSPKFRSLSSVGLVYSHNTADFYGRNEANHRYIDCFMGFYKMFLEDHLLFDVLNDETLNNLSILKNYKVLCLPNVACLSDLQIENIIEYIRSGGKLLLSYETSFFDDKGNPREEIDLGKLLGISFKKSKVNLGAGYIQIEKPLGDFRNFQRGLLIPYFGDIIEIESIKSQAESYGSLLSGSESTFAPAGKKVHLPSIVKGSIERGKFIYYLGKFGAFYLNFEISEIKELILAGVRELLKNGQPVYIKAPSTVEVTTFYNSDKKVMVINFVNHTYSGKRIEEIVPIHDIKIYVLLPKHCGRENIESFSISTEGREKISFKVEKDKMCIILPKLETYKGIVLKEK